MTKTRHTPPEFLKREAVEHMLTGTPLRHVAKVLDITESLQGKWKRQFSRGRRECLRSRQTNG